MDMINASDISCGVMLYLDLMCIRDGLDRSCLLRSVCEVSAAPISQNNVIGELLQTLLTYVSFLNNNPVLFMIRWVSNILLT